MVRTRTLPSVRRADGFSLLELIVVVAMIGILAALALPNLVQTPRRADEAVLRTNLRTLRETLDQYYADQGTYPGTLEALVEEGYLRDVPYDPVWGDFEWGVIYEDPDPDLELEIDDPGAGPGIIDVFSLSEQLSLDGEPYAEW